MSGAALAGGPGRAAGAPLRWRAVAVAVAAPQQSRAADAIPLARSPGASLSRRRPLSSARAKSSGARFPPRLAASRSAAWPERRSASCHQGSWCHSSVLHSRARAHSVSLRRTPGVLFNFYSIRFRSIPGRTARPGFPPKAIRNGTAPTSGSVPKTPRWPVLRSEPHVSHLSVPMPNPIGWT